MVEKAASGVHSGGMNNPSQSVAPIPGDNLPSVAESTLKTVELRLLSYCPPGSHALPFGVLTFDPIANELRWKFRSDIKDRHALDELDLEYLTAFTEEFASEVKSMDPGIMFKHLDESLSNILRVAHSERISCQASEDLVNQRFDDFIGNRL